MKHVVELDDGWYCLITGDIPKNIDYAELMRAQFTIDFYWHHLCVCKYGKHKSLDMHCFET